MLGYSTRRARHGGMMLRIAAIILAVWPALGQAYAAQNPILGHHFAQKVGGTTMLDNGWAFEIWRDQEEGLKFCVIGKGASMSRYEVYANISAWTRQGSGVAYEVIYWEKSDWLTARLGTPEEPEKLAISVSHGDDDWTELETGYSWEHRVMSADIDRAFMKSIAMGSALFIGFPEEIASAMFDLEGSRKAIDTLKECAGTP